MGIRDDVIAWNASNPCIGQVTKRKLLVRSHVDTIEQINPLSKHPDIFETTAFDSTDTSDYIYLRLFPTADSDDEVYGDGTGLKNTFSRSAVFAPSTTRRGIRCTISDRRRLILDIMRSLVDISETSVFNLYKPIKVIDFCTPEPTEDRTIRYGEIQIDKKPGLIKRGDEYYCTGDWEFLFRDTKLRIN
jgi:hypothetical protein